MSAQFSLIFYAERLLNAAWGWAGFAVSAVLRSHHSFRMLMDYNPKWSLTAAFKFSMSPSDNFPKRASIRALLTVVN